MSVIGIPLDLYLDILKGMSLEDHPYKDDPNADKIGPLVVGFSHAAAALVEGWREIDPEEGYEKALASLDALVHTFPAPDAVNGMGLEQILTTLLGGAKSPFGGFDLA